MDRSDLDVGERTDDRGGGDVRSVGSDGRAQTGLARETAGRLLAEKRPRGTYRGPPSTAFPLRPMLGLMGGKQAGAEETETRWGVAGEEHSRSQVSLCVPAAPGLLSRTESDKARGTDQSIPPTIRTIHREEAAKVSPSSSCGPATIPPRACRRAIERKGRTSTPVLLLVSDLWLLSGCGCRCHLLIGTKERGESVASRAGAGRRRVAEVLNGRAHIKSSTLTHSL